MGDGAEDVEGLAEKSRASKRTRRRLVVRGGD
jgi:hypothetical protein